MPGYSGDGSNCTGNDVPVSVICLSIIEVFAARLDFLIETEFLASL